MEPHDCESTIKSLHKRLEEQENTIQHYKDEDILRKRAMEHVRLAIDEAIAFTGRWTDLVNLPSEVLVETLQKRKGDISRLHDYLLKCKQNFDQVLQGFPTEEVERLDFDEGAGDNAGEGNEPEASGQEHEGDSGSSAPVVDDTGGEEEQTD